MEVGFANARLAKLCNSDAKLRGKYGPRMAARIQQRLGLMVCVNANNCMDGWFNGEERTAHLDDLGQPFFEAAIPGRIGCPLRLRP